MFTNAVEFIKAELSHYLFCEKSFVVWLCEHHDAVFLNLYTSKIKPKARHLLLPLFKICPIWRKNERGLLLALRERRCFILYN